MYYGCATDIASLAVKPESCTITATAYNDTAKVVSKDFSFQYRGKPAPQMQYVEFGPGFQKINVVFFSVAHVGFVPTDVAFDNVVVDVYESEDSNVGEGSG